MDKFIAFSYLIEKFKDWYCELRSDNNYEKRFTKLFLLKMLFLVAAVKNEDGTDLLDIFNNFHALPYGPVESDIYNTISLDGIPNYTISDRNIKSKDPEVLNLTEFEKNLLNKSVDQVRQKNGNLITLSPFDLVQITHKWESWDKAFNYAKFTGSRSAKMKSEWIRNDITSYFGD